MNEQILLETPVVDAIVGREPSWIVRSGITLVFAVVILLLFISWFIQYPDTLTGKVTLTTQEPPAQLVAKTQGRITHIFVADGDFVTADTALMLLENDVDYDSLNNLQHLIIEEDFSQLLSGNWTGLGELQPSFNLVIRDLQTLTAFESSQKHKQQMGNNAQLILEYQKLQQQYQQKIATMQQQIALEQQLLNNSRKLSTDGLATVIEMVRIENSYLSKKMALKDLEVQTELNGIKIKELQHKNRALQIEFNEKYQDIKMRFNNSLLTLKSRIENWKHQYQLTAPIDGTVFFADYWNINQQVNTSDVVVSVVDKSANMTGRMRLEQFGMGNVKQGQQVNIELDSFPATEFGKMQGVVERISSITGQNGYFLEVRLPDNLETSHGIKLSISPNATGVATIITQKKRLVERFLDKILYAFEKST